VSHAVEVFYNEPVSIENASREVIDEYLEKLWGLKLGKNNSRQHFKQQNTENIMVLFYIICVGKLSTGADSNAIRTFCLQFYP